MKDSGEDAASRGHVFSRSLRQLTQPPRSVSSLRPTNTANPLVPQEKKKGIVLEFIFLIQVLCMPGHRRTWHWTL
jgi:hypothetical protein